MSVLSLKEELLFNSEAAALLGIKPGTLAIWRHKGKGPKFIKLENSAQGHVRYRRSDVEAWLDEKTFASTTAFSPKAAPIGPAIRKSWEV